MIIIEKSNHFLSSWQRDGFLHCGFGWYDRGDIENYRKWERILHAMITPHKVKIPKRSYMLQ